LQAATRNAAIALGRNDLGTVEIGKLADAVIYGSDPVDPSGTTLNIRMVVKGGVIHESSLLLNELRREYRETVRDLWIDRVLRLLRLFRILKLTAYVAEFGALGRALAASRRKILVFLSFVLMVVLIMGTLMYVAEGPANGYTSIPLSVYWAITTMTTVGFGDITPQTDLGRVIASVMMLLGWGTLAVPTGIVSAEFTAQKVLREPTTRTCHECLSEGHWPNSQFCRDCGAELPPYQREELESG